MILELLAPWRSGYAGVCKTSYTSSILVGASKIMMNKEHIPGGVQLRSILRMDGRMQYSPSRLDFRQDAQAFTDAISDDTELLEKGLIIGFASRFYTIGDKSKPVAFRGVHTGDFRTIQVPRDKFNPGKNLVDVNAPVFDLDIASLDTTKAMAWKYLGKAAIPYVLPARYPFLQGIEVGHIGTAVGIEVAHSSMAHVDGVRPDSLYYVPNNTDPTGV